MASDHSASPGSFNTAWPYPTPWEHDQGFSNELPLVSPQSTCFEQYQRQPGDYTDHLNWYNIEAGQDDGILNSISEYPGNQIGNRKATQIIGGEDGGRVSEWHIISNPQPNVNDPASYAHVYSTDSYSPYDIVDKRQMAPGSVGDYGGSQNLITHQLAAGTNGWLPQCCSFQQTLDSLHTTATCRCITPATFPCDEPTFLDDGYGAHHLLQLQSHLSTRRAPDFCTRSSENDAATHYTPEAHLPPTPLSVYESTRNLLPHPDSPPPSEPDLPPYREPLVPPTDLYSPQWTRGSGTAREGHCGHCGRWFTLKNSAYWYHQTYTHHVSAVTGRSFDGPLERRDGVERAGSSKLRSGRARGGEEGERERERARKAVEGLCGSCGEWVRLGGGRKGKGEGMGMGWFRHAYKCQIPRHPDMPHVRRASVKGRCSPKKVGE